MAKYVNLCGKDFEEFICKSVKGLKAINREARKASQSLRELDKAVKEVDTNE